MWHFIELIIKIIAASPIHLHVCVVPNLLQCMLSKQKFHQVGGYCGGCGGSKSSAVDDGKIAEVSEIHGEKTHTPTKRI